MLTQTQADDLWQHVKDIPVAMMATIDDGIIRSRPMQNVQKEFTGKLWFFTDLDAAKTHEIGQYHEVGLSYEDTHKQLYVSISGSARAVKDPDLINTFWNPMIATWFPEGKEDANVGLIEVDVHQAEVWDASSNRLTQLFKMAEANASNKRPDMGEHQQYGSH